MNITALTVKRADGLNNGILNMKTDVNKDLALFSFIVSNIRNENSY